MAFQTGTITNSHELSRIICGFLVGIGWTKVSTLKRDPTITGGAEDGYDFVFYSGGEDSNRDIYIRVAAGLSDLNSAQGDAQLPYNDGYTEFINGLAYQYFPEDGADGDGFNEIGRFGPSMYMTHSSTSSESQGSLDELNMWKSPDTTEAQFDRKKPIELTSSTTKEFHIHPGGFDGSYVIWGSPDVVTTINKINLYDNTITNTSVTIPSGTYRTPFGLQSTGLIRTRNGSRYIYWQSNGTSAELGPNHTFRFNPATLTHERGFSNSLPWSHGGSGYAVPGGGWGPMPGTKRKRWASNGAPQHRLLYFAPGTMGDVGTGTAQWTYLDGETGKWHESAASPDAPWTMAQDSGTHGAIAYFVTKEMSGYEDDRIYVLRGLSTTSFASIAVDDDGYATGSWSTHANAPHPITSDASKLASLGNYMILISGAYEETSMYKWEFPSDPTDTGSWETISTDAHYSVRNSSSGGEPADILNHLCNRAFVSEFETNTYWLFADLNRLVAVVKNAYGTYNYIYVGAFEPYYSERTARITSAASYGNNVLNVDNSAIFTIGKKYMISDTKGGGEEISNQFGQTTNVAPSEIFTLLGKSGNSLLVSDLKNGYTVGSLVGSDPVPVMSRVQGMEKAQTFDFVSNSTDVGDGYTNIPWRRYDIRPAVDDDFADATSVNARSAETFLYGFVLIGENDDHSGREVRGQLIGVYSAGTSVSSEQEISSGSKKYIVFDIEESGETQRIMVGPK